MIYHTLIPITKETLKCIGVYRILSVHTGKIYIGSTTYSFTSRFRTHRSLLRRDIHRNPHLQNAWNIYGEDNFLFQIIEIVDDKDKVVEREQWYLDHTQRDQCYNIGDVVTNPMQGRTHSTLSKNKIRQKNKGQVRSAETVQRMREAKAGIPISEATRIAVAKKNLGRPLSAEHKHKLSLSQMGVPKTRILRGSENGFSKLTESQVIEIKKMLNRGVSVTEIAKMFSMSVPTISSIKVGRNWAHVKIDA